MTEVFYDRGEHKLTLNGHAGADVKGRDIVCAAMSILAYTYAQACIDAVEIKAAKKDSAVTVFEEGHIEVSVVPYKKDNDAVTAILDSICKGYALLANKYRDNLTFTVKQ